MMNAFFTDLPVITLAVLTILPIAKVFHFSKRIEPLVVRFAKIKPFEKILISLFLLATLCMGSTKSSSSTNSPSPRQPAPRSQRTQGRSIPTTLPQWYLALGYSTTDTDEDGIPDIWEKWTRTKPKVYDSNLDADDDGLTNLEEFINQLDPRHPDTDGDGLDDALELRRMVDGDVAFNPLQRATYAFEELDTNGNAVPDMWEYCGYPYGIENLVLPSASDGNFDVNVTVSTTRSALLTWPGGGVVVPTCKDLQFTIRINACDEGQVELIAIPPQNGISNQEEQSDNTLWHAEMALQWPEISGRNTEKDRIEIGSRVLEFNTMSGKTNDMTTHTSSLSCNFICYQIDFEVYHSGICSTHGGIAYAYVTSTDILNRKDFYWYVNGVEAGLVTDETVYFLIQEETTISIQGKVIAPYEFILLNAGPKTISPDYQCYEERIKIKGAAEGTDHITPETHQAKNPEIEYVCFPNPECPMAENKTYYAGLSHSALHTRNLSYIPSTNPRFGDRIGDPDHCIAVEYSATMRIDLFQYLDENSAAIREKLAFVLKNSCNCNIQSGRYLTGIPKTKDMKPTILDLDLTNKDDVSCVYDRFVMVVYYPKQRSDFNEWYSSNSSMAWVQTLAKPPRQLQMVNGKPRHDNIFWADPKTLSGWLHHNAIWELRTQLPDQHGNQATYKSNGEIITNTIAAGTADYYSPYRDNWLPIFAKQHRENDVYPYIRALQLDGNPSHPNSTFAPTSILRPCMYQGENLNKYLDRRPIVYPTR